MRLFIAINLPDEVRTQLKELQRLLRPLASTAKWVPPESIHITLKFLGEVPEKRVEQIDTALASLAWKPFTISVHSVGFFPGARSPRVLWAGMEAPTMQGLTEALDTRLEPLGFEREKRAFRPHITLARAKTSPLDKALVTASATFNERNFGSFIADRIYLVQSMLKPTGAVYSTIKKYSLEPRSSSSG
jgi:RNA 2',3'-cyclic 3'-phosphodiesterase